MSTTMHCDVRLFGGHFNGGINLVPRAIIESGSEYVENVAE
jgi:hypothetical protein